MHESARFEFERETQLSAEDFVSIYRDDSRRVRLARLAVALAAGVAMLFWAYTLLLGVVLIGFVAFALFLPTILRRVIPPGMRSSFERSPHLHSPVVFGVSDERIWARGLDFEQSSSWRNLATWKENEGWLRLVPNGQSHVYFRTSDLQDAGLYERVVDAANANAPEFGRAGSRAA